MQALANKSVVAQVVAEKLEPASFSRRVRSCSAHSHDFVWTTSCPIIACLPHDWQTSRSPFGQDGDTHPR
jgi:hypothetical protein